MAKTITREVHGALRVLERATRQLAKAREFALHLDPADPANQRAIGASNAWDRLMADFHAADKYYDPSPILRVAADMDAAMAGLRDRVDELSRAKRSN